MGLETMALAAAVAGAAGSAAEGVNAFASSRYQSSVLRNQAEAARQDAGIEAQLSLEDSARQLSQGVTLAAKDGGVAGSALDVLRDLSRQQTYEVNRIAVQGDNASRALMAEARQAKRQGNFAAFGKALQAGAQLAGAPNGAGDGTLLSDAIAKRRLRGTGMVGRTGFGGGMPRISAPAPNMRGVW
ncbi:hypothetical protein [Brevundimonas sp.]|uniref:hypothetical protein n=1 Tax=Brevundimonas sp. TaxID=1871086 RepID=UPI00262E4790|nr:hypothetical protein [Brevundimonas sp.]